nr:Hpt domain-containing protein [Brevundimonas alba]
MKARFRLRAAEDLERLERLWTEEPDSADIRRTVHDLAGSAGIFGHPALGEAALAIDDRYASGGHPEQPQMDLLLQRLREAAG